jgi:acylphosphatase
MKPVRAKVTIRGVVQGVIYRYSTRRQAEGLGVHGWVRNTADGSVEGLFEGRETQVRALLDWCRQGPPAARVSEIDVLWEEFRGEFDGFEVKR